MKKMAPRRWLRWGNLKRIPVLVVGAFTWFTGGMTTSRIAREEISLEEHLQEEHGTGLGMATPLEGLTTKEWHRGNRHG